MFRAMGRRARLKAWLASAAARSPFWSVVQRAIRARRRVRSAAMRWIWPGPYHRARRRLRTRQWRAPAAAWPRGRSAADEGFARSRRPLIRWVKGDGLDDDVTRSAIAQATRLFGDDVDYCLQVNGIDMTRARRVVEWAAQPVHIWRQSPDDNRPLAEALDLAGCPVERFGYWWKWFPPRIRPHAPEWILDGDQVLVSKPPWFQAWAAGEDGVRVSQEEPDLSYSYGQYGRAVDRDRKLYSGLVSLPPDFDFFAAMLALLTFEPLIPPHDGRVDMSEQGCLTAAFANVDVEPIPLSEFPILGTWIPASDPLAAGPGRAAWGYHFAGAFKSASAHYARLVASAEVFSRDDGPGAVERVAWLRNHGQWGVEGWSMDPVHVSLVDERSRAARGRHVLEVGTSRGQLSALMALNGCLVTTLDREDRGARLNLEGLTVTVEIADAADYLAQHPARFALIVVDLHGNDEATWRRLWPLLDDHLAPGGEMLLYNSHLWRMREWPQETGLRWVMETQLARWKVEIHDEPLPGMVICRRG
jgi:predicted O-methyltransferase YrrM